MAIFGFGQQDPYAEAEQAAQDRQTAFAGMKDNLPALGLIAGLSMLARNNGSRSVGQLIGQAGGDALNAYGTWRKMQDIKDRQAQLDKIAAEEREYSRSQDAFRNDMAERKFGLEQAKMAQDMAMQRQRLGMAAAELALRRQNAMAGDYKLTTINGLPVVVDSKTGKVSVAPKEILDQAQAAGGATIDYNNPAVKKFLEDQGKSASDLVSDLYKKDLAADAALVDLSSLEDAARKIYTGKGGEAVQVLRQFLAPLGITAREDAAAGELLQSITNKMAIQARQLFGGMPGALSDRDMKILLSTQPSLSNTREGNMMIIDMQRKLYKRQKDIANLAREYQKKHGYVDLDGFTAVVKDFANKNSLFEQKNSNDPGDIIWPD